MPSFALSRSALRRALEAAMDGWAFCPIGVLGDMVADIYVEASPERLSREAPVMIIRHERERLVPGGAANTANNLLALGAIPVLFGVVGDDDSGRALRDRFRAVGAPGEGLLLEKGRHTVTKTRFMVGEQRRAKHQVLRLDKALSKPSPSALERRLIEAIAEAAPKVRGWALSDYGYHLISRRVLARMRREAKSRPVVADSRYRLLDFIGVSAAKPNEHELADAYHEALPLSQRRVRALGKRLMADLKLRSALVTLGKNGLLCFPNPNSVVEVPAWGDDEVTDVSGAGDTVAAVYTLGLAAGAQPEIAARLANYAAGVVVRKEGTATLSLDELRAAVNDDLG